MSATPCLRFVLVSSFLHYFHLSCIPYQRTALHFSPKEREQGIIFVQSKTQKHSAAIAVSSCALKTIRPDGPEYKPGMPDDEAASALMRAGYSSTYVVLSRTQHSMDPLSTLSSVRPPGPPTFIQPSVSQEDRIPSQRAVLSQLFQLCVIDDTGFPQVL